MKSKTKALWYLALLSAVVWLLVLWLVALYTGPVIVDGFQSIGAAASASGPGELKWSMLGNYRDYDRTWGFHWFGWPLIRSLLLDLVPWSSVWDLLLVCIMLGAAAVLTLWVIAPVRGMAVSVAEIGRAHV